MTKLNNSSKRGRKSNTHVSFLNYIEINYTTQCWEWTGSFRGGYGQFIINNKWWAAHRYSYYHYKGEVENKLVCHTCDNPKCVNPKHLFIGSHSDNTKDCSNKGRLHNPKTKLNRKQVTQIRKLYTSGKSQIELAVIYNVHSTTINAIVNGRTWK